LKTCSGPLAALPVLCALLAAEAFADGKTFLGPSSSLRPVNQDQQMAAIVHAGGVQKMLITVNFKAEDADSALWILPIPGRPDGVKLDVADAFPNFVGRDFRRDARDVIFWFFNDTATTEIYTVILDAILIPNLMGTRMGAGVHASLEKWGIRIEAVTAESLEELADYLQRNEVEVPEGDLASFEPYLSGGYVLVVAWMASREEFLREFPGYHKGHPLRPGGERYPCLYIEFPAERAFYPLRPTSGYGDAVIPVTVFFVGHVLPETSPSVSEHIAVSYHRKGAFRPEISKRFVEGLPERVPYTVLHIETEARKLTDDLRFRAGRPLGVAYAEIVLASGNTGAFVLAAALVVLLAAALLSYLSAGLAGLVMFGRWKGYARVGLWNLLTLVGLAFQIRHIPGERGEALRNTRRWGVGFSFVFSVVFVALTVMLQFLLYLPLGLR
jgi:hypothetical protein